MYDEFAGWRLSPAYDMSFAESMLDRGMNVAGEVWPSAATMKQLFEGAGLTRNESERAIDQAAAAINEWPAIAKESEVPRPMIENVRDRLARLRQSVFPKVTIGQPAGEILPLPELPKKKTGRTPSR
jgi:hypothetical protein